MPKPPRPTIAPCEGIHARQQRIVVRTDGSRLQICERCGHVVAVLVPAGTAAAIVAHAIVAIDERDGTEGDAA